jgi:hypothetical protein
MCGLFDANVTIADYIVLTVGCSVLGELERIWKKQKGGRGVDAVSCIFL